MTSYGKETTATTSIYQWITLFYNWKHATSRWNNDFSSFNIERASRLCPVSYEFNREEGIMSRPFSFRKSRTQMYSPIVQHLDDRQRCALPVCPHGDILGIKLRYTIRTILFSVKQRFVRFRAGRLKDDPEWEVDICGHQVMFTLYDGVTSHRPVRYSSKRRGMQLSMWEWRGFPR